MVAPWPPPAGPPPTFVLDDADIHGIPTVAHCDICGGVWERPPGDSRADTLINYALEHRDAHGQAPLFPLCASCGRAIVGADATRTMCKTCRARDEPSPDYYDNLPEARSYDPEIQPASYENPAR